jgi:hypothetical protein
MLRSTLTPKELVEEYPAQYDAEPQTIVPSEVFLSGVG